jgi:tetratricopeptide (TPR) repeat protein
MKRWLSILLVLCFCSQLLAQDEVSVFQKPPRVVAAGQLMNAATQLVQQKKYAEAETICARAQQVAPFFPLTSYNLACFQALQGKKEESLANLEKAIAAGFANAPHMLKDEDLKELRDEPKFQELVDKAKELMANPPFWKVEQAPFVDGIAKVTQANSLYDPQVNQVRVLFSLVISAWNSDDPLVKGHGEVGKLLNQWIKDGSAAGNLGDIYDNCDRDHSNMDYASFSQLTRIEYDESISKETGYGVQLTNLFHASGIQGVIGNSSTAQTAGPAWRSNPRLAYTRGGGIEALLAQYVNNHLYFYPEHRDHDPGHNGEGDGYGDVYAANLPYVITSQGSSGSDRAFMDAVACTLAAFHPDVKKKLVEKKGLMPAVQHVFRRSNKPVKTDEDYLTGVAHPTVFDSSNLDVLKMIELAHSFTPESLPPLALLKVEKEDQPKLGVDYFDIGEREKLFDTPFATARIWRSTQQKRTYTLSAKGIEFNNRPLTYHWKVLRGDASKIEIKPQGDGSTAEVTLTWQGRAPILPDSKMESNRIDIGLFTHNGDHYSPPAFFCVNTLDNEAREYDDQGRIKSVTYTGASEKGNYVDPSFDIPKSWKDEYRYDDAGKLLGWTRTRGDKSEEFAADGKLILEKDDEGNALKTQVVRYVPKPRPNNTPTLEQVPAE